MKKIILVISLLTLILSVNYIYSKVVAAQQPDCIVADESHESLANVPAEKTPGQSDVGAFHRKTYE